MQPLQQCAESLMRMSSWPSCVHARMAGLGDRKIMPPKKAEDSAYAVHALLKQVRSPPMGAPMQGNHKMVPPEKARRTLSMRSMHS